MLSGMRHRMHFYTDTVSERLHHASSSVQIASTSALNTQQALSATQLNTLAQCIESQGEWNDQLNALIPRVLTQLPTGLTQNA